MFSADVRFEGFTQSDWSRVLTLFKPRATSGKERDPDRPQGGVIVVHGEGRSTTSIYDAGCPTLGTWESPPLSP